MCSTYRGAEGDGVDRPASVDRMQQIRGSDVVLLGFSAVRRPAGGRQRRRRSDDESTGARRLSRRLPATDQRRV